MNSINGNPTTLGPVPEAQTMKLQKKARELWEDFQSNFSIDPEPYYEGSALQHQDELFFLPAFSESFDWESRAARNEHISQMESIIGSSVDDVLNAVEEWHELAEASGVEMERVHATVAEYLPQMLARSKALTSYRNQMLDLFADAAIQVAVSQPLKVNGVPSDVQP